MASTAVVRKKLSQQEEEELCELFRLVDKDGGGTIDELEMKDLLDTIGVNPTLEEARLMFREIDISDDGEIDYSEFVQFMTQGFVRSFKPSDVNHAFEEFHKPSQPKGCVRLADLKKEFLFHLGDKFSGEEDVNRLLKHCEVDEEGFFNFEHYVANVLVG